MDEDDEDDSDDGKNETPNKNASEKRKGRNASSSQAVKAALTGGKADYTNAAECKQQ